MVVLSGQFSAFVWHWGKCSSIKVLRFPGTDSSDVYRSNLLSLVQDCVWRGAVRTRQAIVWRSRGSQDQDVVSSKTQASWSWTSCTFAWYKKLERTKSDFIPLLNAPVCSNCATQLSQWIRRSGRSLCSASQTGSSSLDRPSWTSGMRYRCFPTCSVPSYPRNSRCELLCLRRWIPSPANLR